MAKTLKMDKIGHISERVFVSTNFDKLVITFALLFFARNFQNQCKTTFPSNVTIGIFDFGPQKNLAAKFQNSSGKFWNLTARFSKAR